MVLQEKDLIALIQENVARMHIKNGASTRSDWRQKSGKQYGHTFVSCADSSMCIGQMFIHASMGVADEKIGAMDSGYILNYMMFFLQRFLLERMR